VTDYSVDSSEGSRAVSRSSLYGHVTTVDLSPHTGRTHQLRRHVDMIGHPILGDPIYWFREQQRSGDRYQDRDREGGVGVGIGIEEERERERAPSVSHSHFDPSCSGSCSNRSEIERQSTQDGRYMSVADKDRTISHDTGASNEDEDEDRTISHDTGASNEDEDEDEKASSPNSHSLSLPLRLDPCHGMFLWSVGISFIHPITKERLQFSIPEPTSFDVIREVLR
jgi:hypothetical protein